jgi:hypothetical protein
MTWLALWNDSFLSVDGSAFPGRCRGCPGGLAAKPGSGVAIDELRSLRRATCDPGGRYCDGFLGRRRDLGRCAGVEVTRSERQSTPACQFVQGQAEEIHSEEQAK